MPQTIQHTNHKQNRDLTPQTLNPDTLRQQLCKTIKPKTTMWHPKSLSRKPETVNHNNLKPHSQTLNYTP